jgi:prepilin signal peptidase PulO-like enzyme (type II secretory pathway)
MAVVAGGVLAGAVLTSALRTVVLPQGGLTGITRFMFAVSDRLFTSPKTRRLLPRRLSGLYAPVALVSLPFAWSMLIAVGFALIFWGLGVGSISDAWITSGSSLFTLGFAKPDGRGPILLTFVEATIGLGIVALLISYLPTLYTAYSTREQGVGMLAPLTGKPPSATDLLWRLHAAQALHGPGIWGPTSAWFVAVDQSHSAFPALSRFPPQQADQSWVVTAGTVLDATAIMLSIAGDGHGDDPLERESLGPPVLVLAHGIPAIVRIAQAAGLDVEDPPALVDLVALNREELPEISVSRAEFDDSLTFLAQADVIGEIDAERAWHRYAWLRSGYDTAIRGLAGLTHAPAAPWTSDRALQVGRPHFFSHRPVTMRKP